MRNVIIFVVAAGGIANGVFMLSAPDTWYATVPGVSSSGPFNAHFVRDIGCAYLVAGAAFAWLLIRPAAWPAALAGAGFLTLHALVHVGEHLSGHAAAAGPRAIAAELVGVGVMAVLAIYAALTGPADRQPPVGAEALR